MPFLVNGLLAQYSGGMGGGSSCHMDNEEPVPVSHGGLESGTVIKGENSCEVLQQILYPYGYPSFTAFYIDNQVTSIEVGDKVSGGTRTFKWSTFDSDNIIASSISIKDLTANKDLINNLSNDGTEDVDIGSDKQLTAPGSYQWQINGVNTKNEQFNRIFTVKWMYKVYWGSSTQNTLSSDQVLNLQNKDLKTSFNGTYNFTAGDSTGDYFYIVYPDSWGDVNSAIDCENGFAWDMEDAGTVNVTNNYSVTIKYRLYRTTYKQLKNGCVKIS